AATTVDKIWRYIVGVGAIPALVAIGFRLTIPESPRYTLDVDHDGARALRDTQKYYNIHRSSTNGDFTIMTGRDLDVENGDTMPQIPQPALNHEIAHEEDRGSLEIYHHNHSDP